VWAVFWLEMAASADGNLRQKLSRCLNESVDYKERYQSIKKAFGGIQDPNMKQTVTFKTSLIANDAIDILVSILKINDPSVPKLSSGFDIWDAKGPEWRYKYLLQNYAALSVRRLCEIGDRETSTGLVRLDKIINSGVIDALVPHLYSLECASGFASGALKEICRHEIYRPLIIQANALYPLCLLLNADLEVAKTSIRNSAECLHLLSCSCADMMINYSCPLPIPGTPPNNLSGTNSTLVFNNEMLIQYCFHHIERSIYPRTPSATSSSSSATTTTKAGPPSNVIHQTQRTTDQDLLNTILCYANLTAGYEDLNPNKSMMDMESVYQKINLGQHYCRALYASLNNSPPYLSMRWSYVDILSSILLLVSSSVGKKQLQQMGIKSETSNIRLGYLDLMTACLKKSYATRNTDELKLILEILLHMTFDKSLGVSIQNAKECYGIIRHIANMTPSSSSSSTSRPSSAGRIALDHEEEKGENEDDEEEKTERDEREIPGPTMNFNSSSSGSQIHHPMTPCVTLAKNILFVLSGNMKGNPSETMVAKNETRPLSSTSRSKSASLSKAPVKKANKSKSKRVQPSSSPASATSTESQQEQVDDEEEGDIEPISTSSSTNNNLPAAPPLPSSPSPSSLSRPTSATPQTTTATLTSVRPPYVMISYCWANQPLVFELCRHLKSIGVDYWLDVEKMYGNINDRMAEAIESCAAVIVCLSSKYKLSANCRMEAEYSNTQKKKIIPLMLEENYQPDGWLGLIISGKLWYDMSNPANIHQNVTTVMSELRPVLEKDLEYRKNKPAAAPPPVSQISHVISDPNDLSPRPQSQPSSGDQSVVPPSIDDLVSNHLSPPFLTTDSTPQLDLLRELLKGMESRLQDCFISQIQRVEDHLDRLEKRLVNVESKLS
jgi:hypothetical protein